MIEVLKQAVVYFEHMVRTLQLRDESEPAQLLFKLRQAIAELESQEPATDDFFKTIADRNPKPFPPPQRTWVNLTRTQIENVYFEILKEHRGGHQIQGQLAFGEALQAKIKEKNT